MKKVTTLQIIERPTDRELGEISIELYPSSIGISEDFTENVTLVDMLTKGIGPTERTKKKNLIINHFLSIGFEIVSMTSTPFMINKQGEVTEIRTEVYLTNKFF